MHRAFCRSEGTSTISARAPSGSGIYSISLGEAVRLTMSSVILLTRKLSGVTIPETTLSPSPQLASIAMLERSPLDGLRVNITPAVRELAIFCTPTLMRTFSCGKPMARRYEMARGVNRLDQQMAVRIMTDTDERTHSVVSCWPANEAPGRSSAVALERTATGRAGAPQSAHNL